jgi:hypothetical protein
MDSKLRMQLAQDQLNRVLNFFPRVETKASVLFAVNTGMLAFLAARTDLVDIFHWFIVFHFASVILIAGSTLYLYWCVFPHLEGGASSLLYFREIAKRTESGFQHEWNNMEEPEYLRDILGQIWRNSEILKAKFDYVKIAFRLTSIALVPWAASLTIFSISHAGTSIFAH